MSGTVGSTPNLTSRNQTTSPVVVSTTTTLLTVALITYIVRIYTRCRPYLNLGWDDLAITLAMAITIANWACNLGIQVATGGHHIQYISSAALETAAQLGFISMVLWIWAITTLKVSVALMLLRIKQTPRWKLGIWSLITVLIVVGIGSTLAQVLQCLPVKANWDIILKFSGKSCWTEQKQEIVTYSISALFAATDVTCALLPLFFIVKIKRPLREKVVLSVLMAMGLLACACGLVKTALVSGILRSTDPVWEGQNVVIWTYSEEYIGIMAANIPCLKSLLEAAFRKVGGHVTNMTSSTSKHSAHDLDSYPRHDLNSTSTHRSPIKSYKPYPTRMEEDLVGYHTSLRETSRLKRLERPNSQEDSLLKMKMEPTISSHGFEFEFGEEKKNEASFGREVSINGKRVDGRPRGDLVMFMSSDGDDLRR